MEELLRKNKRIVLPYLIGKDKLRFIGTKKIKSNMNKRDENSISAAIIQSMPKVDIQDHLSDKSKDILERAGDITRTYNKDVLGATHLLYALVDDPQIDTLLKNNGINASLLRKVIVRRIEKGIIPNFILRNKLIKISREVELLLKNTLAVKQSKSTLIEPFHILLELLKGDYPKVSKILRDADIEVSNLVQKLVNENNISY